jgi:hypothetical protein
MKATNAKKKLAKTSPSASMATKWIAQAKTLKPAISQPLTYLDSAVRILRLTLSSKGVFQNLLPVALVLAAYAFVWRRRDAVPAAHWSRADVAVPLGLLAVGVAINVEYTLGRLVAHALPLVVPAAATALERGAATRAVAPGDVYDPPHPDPSRLALHRRLPRA